MAFGVPISYFALRPGKKEPQMFFQIEKGIHTHCDIPCAYLYSSFSLNLIFAHSLAGAMEVDTSEEVEATFSGAG